ncbi:hypothetical protein HDU83_001562 [Entophlyctis luteolus]|nr:hypothetical protein HDU83_001562 [Entophlyctis luteolus]KAJ3387586.1 hypothetical protein HDU84_000700 [Entophlyctis sp. JEL0112]
MAVPEPRKFFSVSDDRTLSNNAKPRTANSSDSATRCKAVMVKTARDACDGSVWNGGILYQDPRTLPQRKEQARQHYSASDGDAIIRDKSAKKKTERQGGSSVPNLEHVYQKHHLESDNDNGVKPSAKWESTSDNDSGSAIIGVEGVTRCSLGGNPRRREAATARASKDPHEFRLMNTGTSVFLGGRASVAALINSAGASSHELFLSLTRTETLLEGKDGRQDEGTVLGSPGSCDGTGAVPGPVTARTLWTTRAREKMREQQELQRLGASSDATRRRRSWEELNRNTEYVRRYDANAIPGLEVAARTIPRRH